jgi:hypothetical protein
MSDVKEIIATALREAHGSHGGECREAAQRIIDKLAEAGLKVAAKQGK